MLDQLSQPGVPLMESSGGLWELSLYPYVLNSAAGEVCQALGPLCLGRTLAMVCGLAATVPIVCSLFIGFCIYSSYLSWGGVGTGGTVRKTEAQGC